MDILGSVSNAFASAGKKARQAYDHTKLDLRIKSYEKELREAYIEIGKMMYRSHKSGISPDNGKLNEHFIGVDNIAFRINQLSKTVADMKKQGELAAPKQAKPADAQTNDMAEIRAFAKLARKEGDLKIRRTEGGIQVLRFCTACEFGNEPSVQVCEGCGYVFRAVKDVGAAE